jgi:hypothetical protein
LHLQWWAVYELQEPESCIREISSLFQLHVLAIRFIQGASITPMLFMMSLSTLPRTLFISSAVTVVTLFLLNTIYYITEG